MLKTGIKNIFSKKGYSLYELMVTIAILSLGIVMVYESFFKIADASLVSPCYIKTQFLIDEIIWQEKEKLLSEHVIFENTDEGDITIDNRNFKWCKKISPVGELNNIYKIDVSFYWKSGERLMKNSRSTYIRI